MYEIKTPEQTYQVNTLIEVVETLATLAFYGQSGKVYLDGKPVSQAEIDETWAALLGRTTKLIMNLEAYGQKHKARLYNKIPKSRWDQVGQYSMPPAKYYKRA